MAWLVDTCVLIDVAEADPRFGEPSAERLQSLVGVGLVVSPVSYAELAPVFDGEQASQDDFLTQAGVRFDVAWTHADTVAAHRAWAEHVRRRRGKRAGKRPIADVLIGAMAVRFDGLVTRNPGDFAALFPRLKISDPMRR